MTKTEKRNNALQMEKRKGYTRFYLDIKDNAGDNLIKVRDILEDVEAKTALIRDAVLYYINSEDFKLERYEGPGHLLDKLDYPQD